MSIPKSPAIVPASPAIAIASASSNTVNALSLEDALQSEVQDLLHELLPKLSEWQRGLVQQQMSQENSKLHTRLIAYLNNVAEVEKYQQEQAAAARQANQHHDDHNAPLSPLLPSQNLAAPGSQSAISMTAAAAAASAVSPTGVAPVIPALSYPSFQACLQDQLLNLLQEEWEELFSGCSTSDGKRISKHERSSKGWNKGSLTYGEVSFHSLGEVLFGSILSHLKVGGTFIDLGSGTARGCIAASYLHPWSRIVGIEILEGLHQAGKEMVSRYQERVQNSTTIPLQDIRRTQKIELYCASFLELDWTEDIDLVFANSTCFDEGLMADIAEQGEKLKDGAYVVTLTKQLFSPYFKLLYSEQHQMSWGNATVNIHIKLTPSEAQIAELTKERENQKMKAAQRNQRRGGTDSD